MDSVLFVTANLDKGWKADEINGLNSSDGSKILTNYSLDMN